MESAREAVVKKLTEQGLDRAFAEEIWLLIDQSGPLESLIESAINLAIEQGFRNNTGGVYGSKQKTLRDKGTTPDTEPGGQQKAQQRDSKQDELRERVKKIRDQCGPPVTFNREGNISGLKERFWAKWHTVDFPDLIFEFKEGLFYDYDNDSGLFSDSPEKLVRELLSQALLLASRTWGQSWAEIDKFNSTKILNGIVSLLSGMIGQENFFNDKHDDDDNPSQ